MIKIVKMTQTCGGCPSQWDGETADGKYIYARYRWGGLGVDYEGINVFYEVIGGPFDGILSEEQLKKATEGVLDFSGCEWS